MANLEFEAAKIANKDSVVPRKNMTLDNLGLPLVLCVEKNTVPNTDGTPPEDAYVYKAIDTGDYAGKVEMGANLIAARDDNGNLWTGEPVDDGDCVNKKYANQHFVPITKNDDYHPYVYVQEAQSEIPSVSGADRIDGYLEATSDNGALPEGDLSEFGGFIPRRKSNGNLLSGTPKTKHEVANKMYVDDLVGDIETALDELHNYAQALIEGSTE